MLVHVSGQRHARDVLDDLAQGREAVVAVRERGAWQRHDLEPVGVILGQGWQLLAERHAAQRRPRVPRACAEVEQVREAADIGKAGGVREQLSDGGLRPVRNAGDEPVRAQHVRGRRVEVQQAALTELEHRHRRHRLRDRADANDGLRRHRNPGPKIGVPTGLDLIEAPCAHEADGKPNAGPSGQHAVDGGAQVHPVGGGCRSPTDRSGAGAVRPRGNGVHRGFSPGSRLRRAPGPARGLRRSHRPSARSRSSRGSHPPR